MRHPRPHLRNSKTQRPLIVTDHPANPITQRFDRLEDASLEGGVVSREHGHHLQGQVKLQFPHDVQSPITFFGLERINRQGIVNLIDRSLT